MISHILQICKIFHQCQDILFFQDFRDISLVLTLNIINTLPNFLAKVDSSHQTLPTNFLAEFEHSRKETGLTSVFLSPTFDNPSSTWQHQQCHCQPCHPFHHYQVSSSSIIIIPLVVLTVEVQEGVPKKQCSNQLHSPNPLFFPNYGS